MYQSWKNTISFQMNRWIRRVHAPVIKLWYNQRRGSAMYFWLTPYPRQIELDGPASCGSVEGDQGYPPLWVDNNHKICFLLTKSWVARRCPGLYNSPAPSAPAPLPSPPQEHPHNFKTSATCPGSSSTYTCKNFSSVSWKLCEWVSRVTGHLLGGSGQTNM